MGSGQRAASIPYEQYLGSVGDRLGQRGYQFRQDGPQGYGTSVYHRRKLSVTKFGFVDYFAVVGRFDSITPEAARAFSEACFRYGLDNKSAFPRGLGGTLVVFPVVVGDDLPQSALQWVSSYRPRHWGAFELPVMVDLTAVTASYNTSKPLWGRAYYNGFQKLVERCLTPTVAEQGRQQGGR